MSQSAVRYLGSRELHRELPRILEELNDSTARLVLTIHAKPKAVMIGAEAFAAIVRQVGELDQKLGAELEGMLQTGNGKVSAEKMKERPADRSPAKPPVKKVSAPRRKARLKGARQA